MLRVLGAESCTGKDIMTKERKCQPMVYRLTHYSLLFMPRRQTFTKRRFLNFKDTIEASDAGFLVKQSLLGIDPGVSALKVQSIL